VESIVLAWDMLEACISTTIIEPESSEERYATTAT